MLVLFKWILSKYRTIRIYSIKIHIVLELTEYKLQHSHTILFCPPQMSHGCLLVPPGCICRCLRVHCLPGHCLSGLQEKRPTGWDDVLLHSAQTYGVYGVHNSTNVFLDSYMHRQFFLNTVFIIIIKYDIYLYISVTFSHIGSVFVCRLNSFYNTVNYF